MFEIMEWKISVPIFKDKTILKQLGIAIGIPFGLVVLIVGIATNWSDVVLYLLAIIGILFFFTWLLLMVVNRGKYDVEFFLNDEGVICQTQKQQAKRNRILNILTIFLGLFSAKPAAMGAGLLAETRQRVFVKWKRVAKVKYKPKQLTIMVRGGWTENIAIFCTKENYEETEHYVMDRLRKFD